MASAWTRYGLAMVAVWLTVGCATERSLNHTLDALDTTAKNASLAEAGIAAVFTSTRDLLDATREDVLLTRATLASVSSITTSFAATSADLAATVSGSRENMIRCTGEVAVVLAEVAATFSETRCMIESLRGRVETPAPKPVVWLAYAFAGGLLLLLGVTIWTHMHVRQVRALARSFRPPPS